MISPNPSMERISRRSTPATAAASVVGSLKSALTFAAKRLNFCWLRLAAAGCGDIGISGFHQQLHPTAAQMSAGAWV